MTTIVLPDSEAIVVGYLQTHDLLVDLTGVHVATFIPDTWTGLCIRVTRVGGTLLAQYADNPRIQLDCWAGTNDRDSSEAVNLAFHAAAAITEFGGQFGNWWVCNTVVEDGPLAEADDNGRPRYRLDFSTELYAH